MGSGGQNCVRIGGFATKFSVGFSLPFLLKRLAPAKNKLSSHFKNAGDRATGQAEMGKKRRKNMLETRFPL